MKLELLIRKRLWTELITQEVLYKDSVYTNEYAGLKISIPDGLTKESAEDYSMSTPDYMTDADQKRMEATLWDADFMKEFGKQGDTDYISIGFVNTELGMPDDSDFTADDFLDADDDLSIRSMEDWPDASVTFDDREKVMLCGKEYVRSTARFSDDEGESQVVYNYARRLDDKLICIICISGTKPVDEYEALFK